MLIEDKALGGALAPSGDAGTGPRLDGLQLAVLGSADTRKTLGRRGRASRSGGEPRAMMLVTESDVKEGLQRSHILYDQTVSDTRSHMARQELHSRKAGEA